MKYKFTFEDGSEAFLAHHGVKGMKWGVWNSETAARYTLKKGSTIRRFTSANEVKNGTDLSKRFYASQNQHDFDLYRNAVDTLPSTSRRYKQKSALNRLLNPMASLYPNKLVNQKIGLISYEAIDDVHVAKGKAVLDSVLKDYGTTKLSELYDDYGDAGRRREYNLSENATVNSVYKSKTAGSTQKKEVGRVLVSVVLSHEKEDSSVYLRRNGKYEQVKSPGKKIYDDLRKKGYDAVKDIEDQLSPNKSFQPTNPLIVLNGSKFKVSESKLIDRDKYNSKTNK